MKRHPTRPTKFLLTVNLGTAEALGLSVPHSIFPLGGDPPIAGLTRPALPDGMSANQSSLLE